MQLARENSNLYLAAINGAAMSLPNSAKSDCNYAKYIESRIRADGLGPGIDFCIRAKSGAVSQVFFEEDVDRGASGLQLYYVTRK